MAITPRGSFCSTKAMPSAPVPVVVVIWKTIFTQRLRVGSKVGLKKTEESWLPRSGVTRMSVPLRTAPLSV